MFHKLLERLRGSSRAPDDLALGTTRPGDFAEDPDVEPNPHERDETGSGADSETGPPPR
jgi:hypothetical protein